MTAWWQWVLFSLFALMYVALIGGFALWCRGFLEDWFLSHRRVDSRRKPR